MDTIKKAGRYQRLFTQIEGLLQKPGDPLARMATVVAVLHNKMEYFFWTGFYLLRDGELMVGPYQGPAACMLLAKDTGVCWAGINSGQPVIVPDVEAFPGHIACDSRSRSEIVIPLFNDNGNITGVLDVDSPELGSFDETDREWLLKIVNLVYAS